MALSVIQFFEFCSFAPPLFQSVLQGVFNMSIDNQTQVKSMLEDFEKSEKLISSIQLRDDRIFIWENLSGFSGTDRLAIVNEYLEQWQQAADQEPVSFRKDNKGRFAANTWLRER